jgi:hypothetical protein
MHAPYCASQMQQGEFLHLFYLLLPFFAPFFAGSLSTDGLLVVRVEATAANSTPSRIAQMAADAQVRKNRKGRGLKAGGSSSQRN